MASKKEISEFLKENNLTEAQVNHLWTELISINSTVNTLNKSYDTWKGCPIHLIKKIPTQKEKDLLRIEKIKIDAEQKHNEGIEMLNKKRHYKDNFEKIMLKKIDTNVNLSEDELRRIIGDYEIEQNDFEKNMWTMPTESIVSIDGRTFSIIWQRGLTENQENNYQDQPCEVKKITKTVVVNEWRLING